MDTGYSSTSKNGNGQNGGKMKCTICRQDFVDPRQLSCSHIFCFRCICTKVSNRYGNFTCPMKDGTVIQQDEIDSLPVARNIPKRTGNEHERNEAIDNSDTDSTVSENDAESQNTIFINGLPVTMHIGELRQLLSKVFGTVGQIKFNQKINKLSIYIFKDKFNKEKLKGTAKLTFVDEDSVEEAIEKYNARRVPALNDSKIFVSKWKQNKTFGPPDEPPPKHATDDTCSIIIDGIPTDMSKYQLYPELSKIFTEVGRIKFNPITNKPSIYLFTEAADKSVLTGRAKITFEDEQSAEKAIQRYNGKKVPLLNNSRILVKNPDVLSKPPLKPEVPSEIVVWVLCEGLAASKVLMKPDADIDDLKKAVFVGRNDSNSYQAYYQERLMSPGDKIPKKTTSDRPIILRIISGSDSLGPPRTNANQGGSNSTNDTYAMKHFHILVDNSNVIIPAKTIFESKEYNPNIRVNIKNLVKVIERSGKLEIEIKTRIVGGSVPVSGKVTERAHTEWKSCLYKCMFVERPLGKKEPFVDNALHSEAFNILFHNDNTGRVQQVLVLATGDGNSNEGQTNFPKVVETALTKSWHVELWSWKLALNSYYIDLQKRFPNQMVIKYLDDHRNEITFIQKSKADQD